ncbi:MAG: RNA polymerase sigma factor [Cyclobacteriaceae bacterium]|nr:RNA polymerase sigma factor [Cyclobacteriaceae bacterium]
MSNPQAQKEVIATMVQTDEELVERSKQGDAQAFKELVVRHEGKVAGVVHSMLGATPEAEDVGQDVFIRFYQALDKFKGESAVSTYLIRIAINLSLNEIKRRKRRFSLFAKEEEASEVKAPDETSDLRDWVMHEVNRLGPEFQSVVTLRMLEGYSTEETATILGVPMGTVLSRLSRAQKKLKIELSKHLEI